MDKFTEAYLNIITEGIKKYPKAKLIKTKQWQSKVGPITDYFYQNELGNFQITYEPYGSETSYQYVYTFCRIEINKFGKESNNALYHFKTLKEAIAFGEKRLVEFTQERTEYYNGLRDWVNKRPNQVWLD